MTDQPPKKELTISPGHHRSVSAGASTGSIRRTSSPLVAIAEASSAETLSSKTTAKTIALPVGGIKNAEELRRIKQLTLQQSLGNAAPNLASPSLNPAPASPSSADLQLESPLSSPLSAADKAKRRRSLDPLAGVQIRNRSGSTAVPTSRDTLPSPLKSPVPSARPAAFSAATPPSPLASPTADQFKHSRTASGKNVLASSSDDVKEPKSRPQSGTFGSLRALIKKPGFFTMDISDKRSSPLAAADESGTAAGDEDDNALSRSAAPRTPDKRTAHLKLHRTHSMGGTNDFHDSISTDSSSSGIASSTSASANAAASSSLDPTTSSALATSDDAKHSGSKLAVEYTDQFVMGAANWATADPPEHLITWRPYDSLPHTSSNSSASGVPDGDLIVTNFPGLWRLELGTNLLPHDDPDVWCKLHFDYPTEETFYATQLYPREHYNFISVGPEDPQVGPVIISLETGAKRKMFRILIRTKEGDDRFTLSSPKHGAKDILKMIQIVHIKYANLKFARIENDELERELLQMEQRQVDQFKTFKFGVLFCKDDQKTETEMYHNKSGSPAFEEFLELLGTRIELNTWQGFRGGLDVEKNSTGTHSVYTDFEGVPIMFHVSTLLPFFADDPQQLERKRHIGNDVIVIVFKDGTSPVNTSAIISQFPLPKTNPADATRYRIGCAHKMGGRPSTPMLLHPAIFEKNDYFRRFLLYKLINMERGAFHAPAFADKMTRTRTMQLRDLVTKYERVALRGSFISTVGSALSRSSSIIAPNSSSALGPSPPAAAASPLALSTASVVAGSAPSALSEASSSSSSGGKKKTSGSRLVLSSSAGLMQSSPHIPPSSPLPPTPGEHPHSLETSVDLTAAPTAFEKEKSPRKAMAVASPRVSPRGGVISPRAIGISASQPLPSTTAAQLAPVPSPPSLSAPPPPEETTNGGAAVVGDDRTPPYSLPPKKETKKEKKEKEKEDKKQKKKEKELAKEKEKEKEKGVKSPRP